MSIVTKHLTDTGWKTCVAATPATCTAKFRGNAAPHQSVTANTLEEALTKLDKQQVPSGKVLTQKDLDTMLDKLSPVPVNSNTQTDHNTEDGKLLFTMGLQKSIDQVSVAKIEAMRADLDFSMVPKARKAAKPVENEYGIVEPVKEAPQVRLPNIVTGEYRKQLLDIFTGFTASSPKDQEDYVAARGRDVVNRLVAHVGVPREHAEAFLANKTNFAIVKNVLQDSIRIVK